MPPITTILVCPCAGAAQAREVWTQPIPEQPTRFEQIRSVLEGVGREGGRGMVWREVLDYSYRQVEPFKR